jgi:hypothetical protein
MHCYRLVGAEHACLAPLAVAGGAGAGAADVRRCLAAAAAAVLARSRPPQPGKARSAASTGKIQTLISTARSWRPLRMSGRRVSPTSGGVGGGGAPSAYYHYATHLLGVSVYSWCLLAYAAVDVVGCVTCHSTLCRCPAAAKLTRRQQFAAHARNFQRLLENQGSWEPTAAPGVPAEGPPVEAWEALGQHAPELAELAVGAADLASSLRYFQVCTALVVPLPATAVCASI